MRVEVSPGVSYCLRDVINTNYRLYHGKFESGEIEPSGFRKVFYRMIWVVFRTIIMASQIDLKDMNTRSLNGIGYRIIFMLKMVLYAHFRKTFFGEFIDRTMETLVWHGSVLVKRCDGAVNVVDWRNYVTEPSIKDPQKRSHVERIFLTYDEILTYKEEWKSAWPEIIDTWKKMQNRGDTYFQILEYWTWVKIKGETVKGCIKYLDRSEYEPDRLKRTTEWTPHVELDRFKSPFKREIHSVRQKRALGTEYELMFPYEQADLFDAPGRMLSFGCAELLEGLSEHYNQYTNDKRKKDILDLKGIFINNVGANNNSSLLQEHIANLDQGAVLRLENDESFQRLVIDTKTGEYIANVDKLYEIMRLVMGVTSQATGLELPSNTSATQAAISNKNQQTTYDYVQQKMHHFLRRLMMNGYLEDILNELEEEELTQMVGEPRELVEMDRFLVENAVNKWASDVKAKTGLYPPEEEYVAQKENLLFELRQGGDTRFPEFKKELLKGAKFMVDFYVTGESFDKRGKLEALAGMKNDPTSTKSKQKLEDAMLDLMNENPRQFDKTEEEKMAEAEMIRQQMLAESGMMTPANPVGVSGGNTPVRVSGEDLTPHSLMS